MFSVKLVNPGQDDSEIVVTGTLTEGEKLHGFCCPDHDWEVSYVMVYRDNDPVTEHNYWGGCYNPNCPEQADADHWHGVSHHDGFTIAEWLIDNPQ